MQRTLTVLATVMVVALGSAHAGAADTALTAGKLAKLMDKTGTAADQAIVKFVKDPALQGVLPGPLCPVVSTVRLRTDTHDVLVQLDCAKWSITGSGYAYKDPTGSAGGVQKVQISTKATGGKMQIKMKGDNYGVMAFAGPATFFEAELVIGTSGWCGRFGGPFTKNALDKLQAKGPSIACVPPPTATPTITSTATITRTPTVTRTASNSPTATQTRTPSNTATVTSTGTATWTITPTFTVPPGSTATNTGTATATATVTGTATATGTETATGLASPTFTLTFTPTPTPIVPTVFRIDSIALRDPHIFVSVIGCTDATNPPGILGLSANGEIANRINADSEPDGFLDINILALFRPLQQPPQPGALLELSTGQCTVPLGGETCSPDMSAPGSTTYSNQASGTCLSPIAGTTGPNNTGNYSPTMTLSSGPCFSTTPVSISFPFGLFTIPLDDVRGSATYVGDPASQLISGLLFGFLPETAANAILLPSTIPLIGGQPLSKFLPGGAGGCSGPTAKDIGPGATPGWYFYLNFTAHEVAWTGP